MVDGWAPPPLNGCGELPVRGSIMFMMEPRLPAFMRQAVVLATLLLLVPLSGCFGDTATPDSPDSTSLYPSIWDRHTLEWNWTGSYARVLQDGPHKALPVQEALIEVDTSGTWEGGPNTAEVHLLSLIHI